MKRLVVDLWLLVRIVPWMIAMSILKWIVPLPRLVRLAWSDSRPGRWTPARLQRGCALADRIYQRMPFLREGRCLERSLVIYHLLSEGGSSPRLTIGMLKVGGITVGHAWVTIDDEPVGESHAMVDQFSPMMRFGERGAVEQPNEEAAVFD